MLFVLILPACARDEQPRPVERPAPAVVVKPKLDMLTETQRKELGFPDRIISTIEEAAGTEAEPFFRTVLSRSENLRGEMEIEQQRLAGFSVRAAAADDIISAHSGPLRRQGYLLFRSRKNYGSVPDVLTVIKAGSSYDILRVQRTEAPSYKLTTDRIITWLKTQQKDGSFYVTGAGHDFVEARFVRQPADMTAFARKVIAFSPDILREGPRSVDRLAERMKRTNGFRLVWD